MEKVKQWLYWNFSFCFYLDKSLLTEGDYSILFFLSTCWIVFNFQVNRFCWQAFPSENVTANVNVLQRILNFIMFYLNACCGNEKLRNLAHCGTFFKLCSVSCELFI